jgi:hypothetical protein
MASLLLMGLPSLGLAAPQAISFMTCDKVTIQGSYYRSDKGKRAPCAILLHPVGENSRMEGWSALAESLQKKGIAVLSFDFRGHGDSTSVEQEFWLDPVNQTLKSFRRKPKLEISYKDFTLPRHYAMLLQDIAAARHFLDERNDAGECNSSNLILIGAESGAALGALWTNVEWGHRRTNTAVPAVTSTKAQYEGEDITCGIWLGMTPTIGKMRFAAETWLRSPVREKVPMYFLYGEGDKKAATYASHICDGVLRSNRDKQMKHTTRHGVKDAKRSGRELLQSPETLDLIDKYLTTVQTDRGGNPYTNRDSGRSQPVRIPVEQLTQ